MPIFRGSKDATIVNGEVVATQADIVEALRDVNIVATNLNGENTIETVASINNQIINVSEIEEEILQVRNIKDEIGITADNVEKVTNFSDVYLGASNSNPETRTDGSSLVEGDLYFNTSLEEFRAWTGTEWYAAPPNTTSNVYIDRFSGDGQTTDFTLRINPKNRDFVQIYIDGVYQQKNTYSLSNSVISFSEAPPLGLGNIEFVVIASVNIGETDAYLVNVEDSGDFYNGDDTESVLQEVGNTLNTKITETEAKNIFSSSGDLLYDASTGEFSVTTYKSSDFDTDFSGKDTDDLSEGTGNLYYTDSRARNALSASGDLSYDPAAGIFSYTERTNSEIRNLFSAAGDLSYNLSTGEFSVTTYKSSDFDSDFSGKSTSDLSEGSNLYYTDTRARNALGASGDLNYNSTTGQFSVTTYKSSDFDSDFSGKSTSDLSEGSNLYYTDTRVDSHLSGGTGVSYSSGTISIGQAVGTADNVTFNDVVVDGNLTVSGTTTTVNTETLDIADNNVTLNSNYSGSSPTENGGITVNRGTVSDVVLQWNETNDYWEIASGGTTGRILTTGDEGSGNGLDADFLDGQQGSYYLNYNNFTNTPTIGNGTLTVSGGSGLTGSGTFDANATTNNSITLDHADTSTQGSVNNSGRTYIQDVTLDGFGHVTGLVSATETVTDTNDFVSAASFNTSTGVLTLTRTDSGTVTEDLDGRYLLTTGKAADADLLDGLNGTYYLDYNNFTNTPTLYESSDFDTDFSNKSTSDLSEGSNLYYTDSRARSAVSASGDLSYDSVTGTFSYTERTDQDIRNLFSASGDLSYDSATGVFSVTASAGYDSTDFDTDFSSKSTDDLSEGTSNLYYTDTRARNALSASGDLNYDNATGTFSFSETDPIVGAINGIVKADGSGSISAAVAGTDYSDPSNTLVDSDIGSTVQAYDADTAKLDVAQTFTAEQTFNNNIVMANSKGIDFSATGGAGTSELLDDYEEGEWNPLIASSDDNLVASQDRSQGQYTKIGSIVIARFFVRTDSVTSGSGNIRINNLPFAPDTNKIFPYGNGSISFALSFGAKVPTNCKVGSNDIILYSTDGANFASLLYSDLVDATNSNRMEGFVVYEAA